MFTHIGKHNHDFFSTRAACTILVHNVPVLINLFKNYKISISNTLKAAHHINKLHQLLKNPSLKMKVLF